MLIWSISYPVCLPLRWKWEKINIGLSHHLLVHHSKVQHPAEDFDYFPLLWQTLPSLRSISLFSTFSCLIFPSASPAVCVAPASFEGFQHTKFGLLWCLLFFHQPCPPSPGYSPGQRSKEAGSSHPLWVFLMVVDFCSSVMFSFLF